MQVRSDKLWQDQRSVFMERFTEDTVDFFFDSVEFLAGYCEEDRAKDPTHDIIYGIREGFDKLQERHGLLVPEVVSSLLVLLLLHWTYGEELGQQLSPIEKSLVYEVMSQYVDARQEQAKEVDS